MSTRNYNTPAGKSLLKVSKVTIEQRPNGLFSSVTLLTFNRFLPAGTSYISSFQENLFGGGHEAIFIRDGKMVTAHSVAVSFDVLVKQFSCQKPVQSQENNVRETALHYRHLDIEQFLPVESSKVSWNDKKSNVKKNYQQVCLLLSKR